MTKLIRNPPGLNHVLLSQLIKSIQIKQKLQVRRLLYNVSTWSVLHLPHHQTLWPADRVHFYHVQVCANLIDFCKIKNVTESFSLSSAPSSSSAMCWASSSGRARWSCSPGWRWTPILISNLILILIKHHFLYCSLKKFNHFHVCSVRNRASFSSKNAKNQKTNLLTYYHSTLLYHLPPDCHFTTMTFFLLLFIINLNTTQN